MDRLVGGAGTLSGQKPIKTIGSYWPYATTLYDYVHRAMPFSAPQSLSPGEVYSVVAWLLYRNGIIAQDFVLDAQSGVDVLSSAYALIDATIDGLCASAGESAPRQASKTRRGKEPA